MRVKWASEQCVVFTDGEMNKFDTARKTTARPRQVNESTETTEIRKKPGKITGD